MGTSVVAAKIRLTVRDNENGFFIAKAEFSPESLFVGKAVTLPQSLLAHEVECESRTIERAISYALTELAVKISGGR